MEQILQLLEQHRSILILGIKNGVPWSIATETTRQIATCILGQYTCRSRTA